MFSHLQNLLLKCRTGFWGGRFQRTFYDVRIFNPNSKSYRSTSVTSCYKRQEMGKKKIRGENKYSGTCILHSHYFGLHGWLQQDHNNIYQETLFTDLPKEKSSLQQNRQLGPLPPWICPPSGMHHVIEGIKGKVPPYQRLQHFACKCRRSSYINDGYRLIYMIYNI